MTTGKRLKLVDRSLKRNIPKLNMQLPCLSRALWERMTRGKRNNRHLESANVCPRITTWRRHQSLNPSNITPTMRKGSNLRTRTLKGNEKDYF
ncbi:hypothetical protein C7212DRAFT_306722, partial [Tuber magnatum]